MLIGVIGIQLATRIDTVVSQVLPFYGPRELVEAALTHQGAIARPALETFFYGFALLIAARLFVSRRIDVVCHGALGRRADRDGRGGGPPRPPRPLGRGRGRTPRPRTHRGRPPRPRTRGGRPRTRWRQPPRVGGDGGQGSAGERARPVDGYVGDDDGPRGPARADRHRGPAAAAVRPVPTAAAAGPRHLDRASADAGPERRQKGGPPGRGQRTRRGGTPQRMTVPGRSPVGRPSSRRTSPLTRTAT